MVSIADTLRNNDLKSYQRLRYLSKPEIPDGEKLVLKNEDFSGTNFDKFSMGFVEFKNYKLDNVSFLYGQPITILDSSARKIDMRNIHAIIYATNVDFTGMLFDDATKLAYGDKGSDAASVFTNCHIDKSAADYFSQQGVIFRSSTKR